VSHLFRSTSLPQSFSAHRVAQRTAGLGYTDLAALRTRALKRALLRAREICGTVTAASRTQTNSAASRQWKPPTSADLARAGLTVSAEDLEHAIKSAQSAQGVMAGQPSIPSVKWDDIGGLAHAKTEILDTIQA
jgi:peroxin-6